MVGTGFSFEAPAGWSIERAQGKVSARQGSELVQVATFKLLKPYRPALFDRVARELSTRMAQVAAQSGGTLTGRSTVTAGGVRSHVYVVTAGDHVDRYTFVLRELREYQLLCRRERSHDDRACRRLVRSFATA